MLYGIPLSAKDPDMVSAVLEALASESYYSVTPALFETALKVKYTRDDESAQMFDIIRETVVFDCGRLFADSFNSLSWSLVRNALNTGDTGWASVYASNKSALESHLDALIASFDGE